MRISIQWASPERAGSRTLWISASSLDELCRRIAALSSPAAPRDSSGRHAVMSAPQARSHPRGTVRSARRSRRPSRRPRASAMTGTVTVPRSPPPDHNQSPPVPPRGTQEEMMAPVVWTGAVEGARYRPPATLVQIQTRQGASFLLIEGSCHFDLGAAVRVRGVCQPGMVFTAERLNGAANPTTLQVKERTA